MVTVIIPSLNPDEKLMMVVNSLIETGFNDIVLVNDGSDADHMEPFNKAKELGQCTVLHHEINRGKGRALKTAFEYCLKNRKDIAGVVTVDGDNQHRAEDIRNCARVMEEKRNHVILGVRNFNSEDVPFKSRFGNHMTSFVFRFACGMKISDTQTGLRAIPYEYLSGMCQVSGERFEYETNMLLEFKRNHIPYDEVTIQTVYINENETTHFHPIRDSFKIYAIIFKFVLGSLSACLIDLFVFSVIKFLTAGLGDKLAIFISTALARGISSFYNYNFNRKAVFESKEGMGKTVVRYYVLCVIQMLCSFGLVYAVTHWMALGNVGTIVAKAVIDTLLFFISFKIQRAWVFRT
ncbi:MAG: glycosyltransferase [Lachnospiraceae bacterium]